MRVIEQSVFHEALSRSGMAANIGTTGGLASHHGMAASAVCSVTDTPPTILICVNRETLANAGL